MITNSLFELLCDDVFGEENTETYIWNLSDFEESSFTKTASNTVRQEHEYIIAAFKNEKILKRYTEYRFLNRDDFSNPDNDPRGPWMSGNISRNV
jgi:adenine-specific DNA-methyltransferase